MSDVSIPGLGGGKYNTKEIIESSMKVERIPLDRMTAELERSKEQKQVWQELNTSLSRVRDNAAELFSVQSPFHEKTATSTDEAVLTATATREAANEARRLTVEKLATADRFLSRPLDRAYKVQAGRYAFRVGEKDLSFTFAGGSVTEFVEALNKKVGTDLRASLVKDTKDTLVLLLESRLTGAANRLQFSDKSRDLAVEIGMVLPQDDNTRSVDMGDAAVRVTSEPSTVRVDSGELTLRPGGSATVKVAPALALDEHMVLELEVKVTSIERAPWQPPPDPPGPDLPEGESVEFQGIGVRNAPSRMPSPPYTPPRPPETVEDLHVLSLQGGGASAALPEVPLSSQWKRVRIPLAGLLDSVDALVVSNPNTYREIAVRNLRIYDATSRGDTRPVNALSQSADAELTVDGVAVTRDSNTIGDLLPGVSLTLRAPSSSPVELTIGPNTTVIKDKVIAFVGRYNQALQQIDLLTRRDESVLEQGYYETDAEREKAQKRLGLFAGDTTLTRLKSQLTTIMMNAYRTSAGQDMAMLAQIGISTNSQGASGAVDRTRLRGYLEIDEAKLEAALRDRTEPVRELFGSDSDGDLVMDTGAAFEAERTLRAYVGRAGIVAQRTGTIDAAITQKNRQIEREKDRLADTEAELRRKYTEMESSLRSLEESSKRLQGMNQSGN
jgi:flagellar hook-associated protein 2